MPDLEKPVTIRGIATEEELFGVIEAVGLTLAALLESAPVAERKRVGARLVATAENPDLRPIAAAMLRTYGQAFVTGESPPPTFTVVPGGKSDK